MDNKYGLVLVFSLLHYGIRLVSAQYDGPCEFGDKIEYGHLGKEVEIGDGLNAYVSHPANITSRGGVIIIQDIFGWELSNTRAIVDMLMSNSFTAILPDAYRGEPAWTRERRANNRTGWTAFRARHPASGIGDVVNASMEYLRNEYSITKFGMVGFCWGGGAVHYMLARRKDLVAGVSCYGVMNAEEEDFGKLNSPNLFIYGHADQRLKSQMGPLRRALKRNATAPFAIRGYKDQGHGFLHRKLASPDDPNKDQIYAARKKMIRWLKRHMKNA